jgi:branched-chain amino acid transport system substrate-binding protein
MRRVLELSACALMAVVLVALPALGQGPKTVAASGEPIKIGGSLPLTGLASEQAKLIKAGYEYWAEDINKRGGLLGRPVRLIMYDDESSADKAVTYYERAITIDKVDLLFGGYPGPTDVALMPLAEKYGKVFIGQGGHGKSFEQGYTYSFASPPLMSEWTVIAVAGVLEDLIPKAQWPKSAAVFSMNNVIGVSTRPTVVQWLEKNGIKVVVDETYNLPLSDANPLISKAKGRNAEIMFCFSFFDDGVMLTRAAKAMNYNPKMIMHLVASTIPAWMKEMGPDGNNVVANMWWNSNLPFPGNDAINAGAKAKLNLPAGPTFFGLGYCWMKTLELAVQGAGTLDQKTIRDYLRSHTFDLPYMKGVTFDKAGLPPAFNYMIQMTNGQVQLVWPKSVATTKLVYPRPNWSK